MSKVSINVGRSIGTINKNIYGHFSEHLGRCIYQGLFVGEDSPIDNVKGMRSDVVEALKAIKAPVLRWPGGCFADEYHWRDGIGPKESRRRMVNTNWGGVVEDNSFGTHEFLELCEQIGCEPYINANVGSGTVREMAEWVEYLNSEGDSTTVMERWANGRKAPFNVKYWGVGNESWGCGGNMRPSYYADEYRRYQTYCRNYGDNKLYRIGCGPSVDDYQWTEEFMAIAGKYCDAITLHHYTIPFNWRDKGSATEFDEAAYYRTLKQALRMEELVSNHLQIMNRYDPEHKVDLIVDEWGTWYNVEPGTNPGFLYQQNTMRDALVAALTLDIFNSHCDRISMANIAQTVNVLQSVILTEGDKMVLTPTYHVFDLYKAHQDAKHVDCFVETGAVGDEASKVPVISASASEKDGVLTVTLSNTSMTSAESVEIFLQGKPVTSVTGRVLANEVHAYNTFESSPVALEKFTAMEKTERGLKITMPKTSVLELTIQ